MRVRGGVEPRSLGAPIVLPVGSPPSDLGGGAGLSHGSITQGLLETKARGWNSELGWEGL